MPYPNEHSARITDPGKYDSFARVNNTNDKFKQLPDGVSIILGIKNDKSENQAYRFTKDKFTTEQAKKWLKDNNVDYISFEPAKDALAHMDLSFSEGATALKEHDAILQILERQSNTTVLQNGAFVPTEIYVSMDAFKPTVEKWNGIPLIFASEHPNPDSYDEDMPSEMARIGGVFVGNAGNARIDMSGTPKLMAGLDINSQKVEELRKNGTLNISVSYRCGSEGGKMTSAVTPHHILLFERTPGTPPPADKGATFVNQTTEVGILDKVMEYLKELKIKAFANKDGERQNVSEGDDMVEQKEFDGLKNELADTNTKLKENETTFANMEISMKAKDAELKTLRDQVLAFQTKEKEAVWLAFREKIPPGMLHGDDKEAEARTEFEANPTSLAMKVLAFQKQGETGQEGDEHAAAGNGQSAQKGTVGAWDASKGAYQN